MNKPINVEAQRVGKVVADTSTKLGILSMLSKEFFEEIRTKVSKDGPNDIYNNFGQVLGKQIIKHAEIEDEFNIICVPDGVKMVPDDENIEPPQMDCKIALRDSTLKLMRAFSVRENQLKLKNYDSKSSELEGINETFTLLSKLFDYKLSIPNEEVISINESLKILKTRVKRLKELRETKQEALGKYVDDCQKSKEQRELQIKVLKEQKSLEQNNRQNAIEEAQSISYDKEKGLKEMHQKEMDVLGKQVTKVTKELEMTMKNADKEELALRKDFKKASNDFINSVQVYDQDITNQVLDNKKTGQELQETIEELKQTTEEYHMRLEEKLKRDAIATIMKKKNDAQQNKMNLLSNACEFIQAHWRGLMEQRIMEKARKKKKKKKKK